MLSSQCLARQAHRNGSENNNMCRAVGVSGLRVASCTGAAVKITPSGCNQSEEGGRRDRGTATAPMFSANTLISFLEWSRIHLDLAALVNGFEAQPLPTLTLQPQCPAKDTIIMPAMAG